VDEEKGEREKKRRVVSEKELQSFK